MNNQRIWPRALVLGQLLCLSSSLVACDPPDESNDDGTGMAAEAGQAGGSTGDSGTSSGGSGEAEASTEAGETASSEGSSAGDSASADESGGTESSDSSMSEEGEASDGESEDSGDATESGETGGDDLDHVEHEDLGMGVTLTRVNATDHEGWIYLDILAKEQLAVEDQANDATWHLAFRRFVIATNGGISGPAGMSVAILEGQDFDTLTERHEGEFILDGEHVTEVEDATGLVFDDWWDYDVSTHVLAPKERVYVVQLADERQFAVEVVDYYHPEHASSGWPTIRWAELPRSQ